MASFFLFTLENVMFILTSYVIADSHSLREVREIPKSHPPSVPEMNDEDCQETSALPVRKDKAVKLKRCIGRLIRQFVCLHILFV